jgi:hypothetical protein
MQSDLSLICIRKFLLNNYKNINLDIVCCGKHTGHKTFCTMALILSSDKNNVKAGKRLI